METYDARNKIKELYTNIVIHDTRDSNGVVRKELLQ